MCYLSKRNGTQPIWTKHGCRASLNFNKKTCINRLLRCETYNKKKTPTKSNCNINKCETNFKKSCILLGWLMWLSLFAAFIYIFKTKYQSEMCVCRVVTGVLSWSLLLLLLLVCCCYCKLWWYIIIYTVVVSVAACQKLAYCTVRSAVHTHTHSIVHFIVII